MAGLRDFADAASDSFGRWANNAANTARNVYGSASEAAGRYASNRAMNSGASVSEGAMDPAQFEQTFGRPAAAAPQAAEGAVGGADAAANSGALYKTGLRAGRFLSRAAPAVVGGMAISDFGEHHINDPDVDSSAAGTMRYIGNGDWNNAGRSLSKGALEAGMDLMGGVAKLVPGHFIEDRLNGMRSALGNQLSIDGTPQGAQPAAQPSAPGAAQPTAANPTDTRLAEGTETTPGLDGAPHLGADPGSAVAGADGVRKFVTGDGRTLYSNVSGSDNDTLMSGKPGVQTAPGIGGDALQHDLRAADIYHSMADMAGGVADGAATPSYIPGVNAPKTQYEQETDAHNASVKSTLGGKGLSRPELRQQELALEGQRLGLTARGQDLQHEESLAGTNAMREGHKLNFESSVYGTNMSGKNAMARLAFDRGNIAREQANKDRDFSRETSNDARAAANEGQKNFEGNLNTLYTTKDPKTGAAVTDKEAVATHTAMADAYLTGMAQKARANGRPDLADQLERTKYANIGPREQQFLNQAVKMKQLVEQNKGYGPLSGKYVESNNPEDYQIVGKRTNAGGLGSDVYVLKNGAEVPTRAVDWTNGGNTILPNWVGNSPSRAFGLVGQPGANQ